MREGTAQGRSPWRALAAVAGSLLVHGAVAAGALLGTHPSLPFIEFDVAEVEVEGDDLPVLPPDESATARPAPETAAPRTAGPESALPRPDVAEDPVTAAPLRDVVDVPHDVIDDDDDDDDDEPGIAMPETGPAPETAPVARVGQTPPDGDARPLQPSAAPGAEDPALVWRALRGVGSTLGEHVPGDARLAVWLNLAALRRSALRADVAETIRAVDGLDAMFGWAGIDPVDDLEELVIASRNPYSGELYAVARLAAGGNAEARLAGLGAVARRIEIAPGVHAFAPAAAEKPTHVLMAVGKAELLAVPFKRAAKLVSPESGPASRPSVAAAAKGASALLHGEGSAPRAADAPDLLVAGHDVAHLLPMIAWGPEFAPAPASLRLAADVHAGAELHAEMRFASAADAAKARAAWVAVLEELRKTMLLTLLGVRPLLDAIDVWTEGDALRGSLGLRPGEASGVLRAIRPLLVGPPPR